MNAPRIEPVLDRETAELYAEWFRTLADPTRVQLLWFGGSSYLRWG